MFDSPFGSFQNTVAEAKEEREQLDRLLTISTPRERLLVSLVALLLVIFSAWLFLGSVSRTVAVEGVIVSPGDNGSFQALIWVDADLAAAIDSGMPAMTAIGVADDRTTTLDGEVSAVSAVPPPEAIAAFNSEAPVSAYRIDITLTESLQLSSLAGTECRIVIEIGRHSPVALLRMGS